jgi:hypothetical protein
MQLALQGSLACLGMDLCQTACLTHALHIFDFQHRPAQEVVRDNSWLDFFQGCRQDIASVCDALFYLHSQSFHRKRTMNLFNGSIKDELNVNM